MRSTSLVASTTLLLLAAPAHADLVTDWNGTAVTLARDNLVNQPNPASRAVTIAHLAAYDAVVSITKTHEPYHAQLEPTLPASTDAAAAQAFHDALVVLFPNVESALDDQLEATLAEIPDGVAKENGIAVGQQAATDIVELRQSDGADAPQSYPGSSDIGAWRPTPTALTAASFPEWAMVTPFALESPDQFRPPAPPALTSGAYAVAYTEVKLLGKKTGSARTTEQTGIANFWAVQTHIPFNAIARSLTKKNALPTAESVRLFALLNLAIADSRIAAWDAKYEHGFWRPITAIQNIDPEPDAAAGGGGAGGASEPIEPGEYDDGNPDTIADPTWAPLLTTPNHPEYVSGHSATGAAAASVLAHYFGDATSFTVGSDTSVPLGETRSFTSFWDAAEQNAESRVYGGIHFRFSNDAGLALGVEVGNHVVENYLLEIAVAGGAGGAGGEGGVGGASEGGAAQGEAGTPSEGGAPSGNAGEPATNGGSSPLPAGGSGGSGGRASGGTSSTTGNSSDDSGCSVAGDGTDASSWFLVLSGVAAALVLRRRR
jgi:MYXO-CTERM domain-containing protein